MSNKSKSNSVGNRKAGNRNQQPLSKKQFLALPPGQRRSISRPRTGNAVEQMAPAAISRRVTQYSPIERSGMNGSRTIRYKEYVQDILGSALFSVTTFACNPGLPNLFAWLANQALFYQEYTVRSLRFCFETEKATSLSGKVMFAFIQDSSDPAPGSKQEFLENLLKASGAIWQPFELFVSMKNFPALGHSRFIRSGNLAANLDIKTYDIGALLVAVQGMADSTAAGELYIEYEIELRTPIQSAAQLASALSVHIVATAPTAASMFGGGATSTGGLNIIGSGNLLTFNRVGQYLLNFEAVGTVMDTAFVPVLTPGGTPNTLTGALTATPYANGISNAAGNAGTEAAFSILVTCTSIGQTLTVALATQAATITALEVRASMYAALNL